MIYVRDIVLLLADSVLECVFFIAMMRCSETYLVSFSFGLFPFVEWQGSYWTLAPALINQMFGDIPLYQQLLKKENWKWWRYFVENAPMCHLTRNQFVDLTNSQLVFFVGLKIPIEFTNCWWLRGLRPQWMMFWGSKQPPGIRPINRAWAPYNLHRCMLTKKPWRSHLIWKGVGWKLP